MRTLVFSRAFVLILALTLVRCDASKKDWKEAHNGNTIKAYQTFLDKYPTSKYTEQANQCILEIVERQMWKKAQMFNNVFYLERYLNRFPDGQFVEQARLMLNDRKVIKIIFTQSYADEEHDYISRIPIDDIARSIFEFAGFKVAGSDSKEFDYILKLEVYGKALGGYYRSSGEDKHKWYYTGAKVKGKIRFQDLGIVLYSVNFEGKITPPPSLTIVQRNWEAVGGILRYTSSTGAPYTGAFTPPFSHELVEMISSLFDVKCTISLLNLHCEKVSLVEDIIREEARKALVRKGKLAIPSLLTSFEDIKSLEVLEENDDKAYREIITTLGEIGDKEAIEPLITALDEVWARREIADALSKITSQNFGEDPIKWKEWWNKNKVK